MAKTNKYYICSRCGTKYTDLWESIRCETPVVPKQIDFCRYPEPCIKYDGLPEEVVIDFSNGMKGTYGLIVWEKGRQVTQRDLERGEDRINREAMEEVKSFRCRRCGACVVEETSDCRIDGKRLYIKEE